MGRGFWPGRPTLPAVIGSPRVYDVCIVGSGAAGGAAAKVLTEGEWNVAMLEAGRLPQSGEGLHGTSLALRAAAPRRRHRREIEGGRVRRGHGPERRLGNRRRALHLRAWFDIPLVRSVLNKYCQAHEVKNLFVTDASAFVTSPDKNPTLSILALSWRASEYL
jgi:choline dehydrogenase-like flavoprotein